MGVQILFRMLCCLLLVFPTGCGKPGHGTGRENALSRLANAASPYLREHADNPVNWYEWGPEALQKAKQENKLLIVSIGYSSCHWCHVMEKESFMDTTVARIMNENFVSIKVDREERPDIDQIYLNAAQLISGNAGWPLNAFALSDGKPFYAGTYFTKDEWIQMLRQIIEAYKSDNSNVLKQAASLTNAIQEVNSRMPDTTAHVDQEIYDKILNKWLTFFDPASGGITGAPKFPMPVVWESLLQHHYLTKDKDPLVIVTTTLNNMANGGVYDQLGGGFCRYSTDASWRVPHFEKMLYDNAQLVSLYAHAYQVTRDPRYSDVIRKTLAFIEREMTDPDGGFYSSVNADSEDEEGKFYVWTKAEIESTLDSKTSALFVDFYNVTESGNWENGKNILLPGITKEAFADNKGMALTECTRILDEAEKKLFLARARRIRPSLDDKILVSWNALMLKGYIDAYFALGDQSYLRTAMANAQFLEKNMLQNDSRLWRNYKDGKPAIDAFLDDYALLARAFIHLYQATFDIHWLNRAKSIAEYAVTHFKDERSGLFFYTSNASEKLVARKIEVEDSVIPSSNAVLAEVLFLLGEYYGLDSHIQMSTFMLRSVTNTMLTGGPYYAHWASLLGMVAHQPFEIAIMGDDCIVKSRKLLQQYVPTAIIMGGINENLPLMENKRVDGRTIIYVCRNRICKAPEEDVERAIAQLR